MSNQQIAVIETDAVVVSMNRARMALAEAQTIQQTKRILDTAAAAEIYAKRQKLGEEASDLATSIKIEALRKLGEMLAATPRASGVQKAGTVLGGAKVELPKNDAPTLEQLGLTKKESAVAQKLAALPEKDFEQVRDGHVTVSKAIAAVETQKKAKKAAPASKAKIDTNPVPAEMVAPDGTVITAADMGADSHEMLLELQRDYESLVSQLKAVTEADDQKAETVKWHKMYEQAMRSADDQRRIAAECQKREKRLAHQVRECCLALGLQDPRQLVQAVKKLAARREAA